MIQFFFKHLSICHNVSVENVYREGSNGKRIKTNETRLSASSPDEQALVAGAKAMGYDFLGDSTIGGMFRRVRESKANLNGEENSSGGGCKNNSSNEGGNEDGPETKYTLLDCLEFTSKRKRMTVIVLENGPEIEKDPSIEPIIRLYCKGADNVIFERLNSAVDANMLKKTNEHLSMYAEDGLRTLAVATKLIKKDDYNTWKSKYTNILLNEEEETKRKLQLPNEIDNVMELIENDLELIGATAIEDKLQNGVPDAVADLAKAGIKVWVLTGNAIFHSLFAFYKCTLLRIEFLVLFCFIETGDKQETAINIGFATQLLRRDMDRTIINGLKLVDDNDRKNGHNSGGSADTILKSSEQLVSEIQVALSKLEDKKNRKNVDVPVQALIIDGKALDIVFSISPKSKQVQQLLLRFVRQCGAVVACRVSPLQKAQMVNLIKKNEPGVKTLSIGDGANDVPMIQNAHVGVGISGQEGMQAVNASDYAIGQFRFLTRLLIVHGRWNYRRMSVLVSYMFYKNIVLCMVCLQVNIF